MREGQRVEAPRLRGAGVRGAPPPLGGSWLFDGYDRAPRAAVALAQTPARSLVLAWVEAPELPGDGRSWTSPGWHSSERGWRWCAVGPSPTHDIFADGFIERRPRPHVIVTIPGTNILAWPAAPQVSLEVRTSPVVTRREGDGSLSWFPRAFGDVPAGALLSHPSELRPERLDSIGPVALPPWLAAR